MNFKHYRTGKIPEVWKKYFSYKTPEVPQGVLDLPLIITKKVI